MVRRLFMGRGLSMIAAIAVVVLTWSHFGCSGGGGEGDVQNTGDPDIQTPAATEPGPTVSVKLVRLDGQEMDLSSKPIPLSVSLKLTFSEAMDTASVEAVLSLQDGAGNNVPGTFSWNAESTEATFKPQQKLQARTLYKLMISADAASASKAAMDAVELLFTTMTAGDIDGDGVPDLLVAAGGNPGSIYIYSGAALANNPIAPMVTISGEAAGAGIVPGSQVAIAGDVDADGYADVLISDPSYDSILINDIGAAFFFSGFALAAAQPVSKKISEADASLFGRQLQSCAFGTAISGGHDVDGDGYDDLVVGEPADANRPGAVYVFSGKGLAGTKTAADAMDIVSGSTNGDGFGLAVSGLRDVDGDGKDELMASIRTPAPGSDYLFAARDLSINTQLTDAAAVISSGIPMFFGQTLSSAGDVNGDGIDDPALVTTQSYDVYIFSGKAVPATGTANLNETNAMAAFKNLPGQIGLATSMAGAGDIDGDGRDDVVVGVPSAKVGGVNGAGETWVFGMDAGGAGKALADLSISGAAPNDAFGASVAGVGDIDGDGKADIAVSSTGANGGKGAVHIFSGSALSSGPKYTINGATVGEVLGTSVGGAYR